MCSPLQVNMAHQARWHYIYEIEPNMTVPDSHGHCSRFHVLLILQFVFCNCHFEMPCWSASKMFVIVIFLTTNHFPLIRQKKQQQHTPPFWYYTAGTEESHNELILSLSKNLLRSLETPGGTPNPSVLLALRLSSSHNQAKELIYLNRLKNDLHNDIQRCSVHTLYTLGHINSHVWFILVLCFHTRKLVPSPSLTAPCQAASLWLASWPCTLLLWSPPATTSKQSPSLSVRIRCRCWHTWKRWWIWKKNTLPVSFALIF